MLLQGRGSSSCK